MIQFQPKNFFLYFVGFSLLALWTTFFLPKIYSFTVAIFPFIIASTATPEQVIFLSYGLIIAFLFILLFNEMQPVELRAIIFNAKKSDKDSWSDSEEINDD